jgi:hypothetical protein
MYEDNRMLSALIKNTKMVMYGDLTDAVNTNNLQHLQHLLEAGENPNKPLYYNSYFPLQIALLYSKLDCAILLLQYKANPNVRTLNWYSGTLLHHAVKTRRIAFIRLLLFFGADQNAKNQFNQEVTHDCISNSGINNFIHDVCQQVDSLQKSIAQGNKSCSEENYIGAILYYKAAGKIYEQQAIEELTGTHDHLYEDKNKPNNQGLILYFYKRALLSYQAAENIYTKLTKQKILTENEKKDYYQVLEKIIEFSKKTEQPIVQYLNTMAILSTNHKLLTIPEEQNINQTPMSIMVKVASSSSPLHHVNSGSDTLRKRKKIMLTSENGNHEEKKPLLSTS